MPIRTLGLQGRWIMTTLVRLVGVLIKVECRISHPLSIKKKMFKYEVDTLMLRLTEVLMKARCPISHLSDINKKNI